MSLNRFIFRSSPLRSHRETVVGRPSVVNAVNNHAIGKTCNSRPLNDRAGYSLILQFAGYRAITVLLGDGRPPTITRFIIAVVVDTVKGKILVGALTHVCQEIYVRVSPSVANLYTASAIVVKVIVARIRASLNHILPDTVLTRPRLSMFGTGFRSQATARPRIPTLERVSDNISKISAFTLAYPFNVHSHFKLCERSFKNRPSTVNIARQILVISRMPHMTILTQSPVFMGVKVNG